MILHFDQTLVRRLLAYSQAAPRSLGQAEPAHPGLWLVGDEGVYLMSNGVPGLIDRPETALSRRRTAPWRAWAATDPATRG